ncbi:MAG: CBS domain-containing protein, partial [Acidobacteriota bacterium]
LMVPLDRLTMLEASASWTEVVRAVTDSPFSRIPVYRVTRDRIVGLVRVRDLVDRYLTEGPLPLERLMRPILNLPDALPADRVLAQLRERRAHSAAVIDGAGRALGLITVQDVLGELLGLRTGQTADARRGVTAGSAAR